MMAEAGLPYLAYLILHARGVSTVDALAAGAVFPTAFIVYHFAARRRLDGFGLIILATIATGAGLALLVARQCDGTTVSPVAWDHVGVFSVGGVMMVAGAVSVKGGDVSGVVRGRRRG